MFGWVVGFSGWVVFVGLVVGLGWGLLLCCFALLSVFGVGVLGCWLLIVCLVGVVLVSWVWIEFCYLCVCECGVFILIFCFYLLLQVLGWRGV